MGYQTITLTSVLQAWRDVLKGSAEVKAWCQEKYGKDPKIFVGVNEKRPPKDTDCPFIVLMALPKTEGLENSPYTYSFLVGWSVLNKEITDIDGVIEYPGLYETDELGQMIWGLIQAASSEHPCSQMEYDINADSMDLLPQFPGAMLIDIEVTPAIGGTLAY